MSADVDTSKLEARSICEHCVGEEYLRAEIQRSGVEEDCSYCDEHAKTITIDELSNYIATALSEHFYRTSDEPEGVDYLLAKEGLWDRAGEPVADVIAQIGEMDNDPAEDVRAVLAEREYDFDEAAAGMEGPFDPEAQYAEGSVRAYELEAQWAYFQKSLQTESRLFNRDAYATLESIFEGLHEHRSANGDAVIVDAGPECALSTLYRARIFQSNAALEKAMARPDLELGPPPPQVAAAGRMNAQGIAVFYGATDQVVALAETRPPVGGKGLVGAFNLIRPVRLLDIEALSRIRVSGSVFDPTFLPALEKAKFLESLSRRISRPVMPDDMPFDYLVTQAIADYLAGRNDPVIDGIIYPSVQSGTARNVVLFHKSARVAKLELPKGTEIRAYSVHSTEEGAEPDYRVWEEVPPEEKKEERAERAFFDPELFLASSFGSMENDVREPALRVDVDSLRVHEIRSVTFVTTEFPVNRHRTEKHVFAVSGDKEDLSDLL